MNKEFLEKLVNRGLNTGADFSEVFYEETKETTIYFSSSVINRCFFDIKKGIGIRLAKNNEIYYANTNELSEEKLLNIIDGLNKNFNMQRVIPEVILHEESIPQKNIAKDHNLKNLKELKTKLYKFDEYARSLDNRIVQVIISVDCKDQDVIIANSKGKLVKEYRPLTRFVLKVIAQENSRSEFTTFTIGAGKGLEIIDEKVVLEKIKERVSDAIEKLSSKSAPGGEMPVIISNGFGGVIIHEACGHALEASQIADGTSVLSDKLNQKIASDKVTIIDDGTIPDSWGSSFYDDEGNKTEKNILIENGVVKKFLIDELNNRILNQKISGSGRRQDFNFAPISRMNNTYLAKGNDKIEDMIKSIDYGLYAKTLGGGQVDTSTGDFNFAVLDAYMIREGKIAEPVKGASLVGNTLEILKEIEMVGDDLKLSDGMCGSASGWVPTTVGQPTIKVKRILVGGDNSDQ